MDRTAAVGATSDRAGSEQGEENAGERLPKRRPPTRETEPETSGDQPLGWFGGSDPSDTGSISSPAASAGTASPEATPVSSPPEFGPASPAGPGRVSFGVSDGPIGGGRAGRTRSGEDTGSLPERGRAGGVMGALTAGSDAWPSRDGSGSGHGPGPDPADLPLRRRGSRDTGSGELPIVRKTGNGTDRWSPEPTTGSGPVTDPPGRNPAPAAAAPWPDSFATGASAADSAPSVGLPTSSRPDVTGTGGPFETTSSWQDTLPAPSPNTPVVWSDTPATAPAPPRRRQSRLVTAGMALLGAVALAVVVLTGVVYYTGDDNQISDVLQRDKPQRVVSGPLGDRSVATFEMMAATDRVQVRIDDLGDELYRISAPDGAGVQPSAELRDDRLRVDVTRDAAGTGGEVEVVLAAKVRWTIRFSGYSAERIVDLSEGRIKGIELVGGTRRAEMTLAQAAGTVPMKITGGIEELILRAPAGSPVRIKVGGGAGTVTAGSRTLRDVAPGSTLTPKGWASGNRYDVDAIAPVTLLTVETTRP